MPRIPRSQPLASALVLLAGLLGFLLYTLLARQREAPALRVRTRELDESNAVLQAEIHRRQQSEESLFDAKERAEVTLPSIGDAVITTNARGEVDYLNPVAAQLTGWTPAEARGKPLLIVFPIINELTRLPVDTPVERVLREGRVVGLANHTVLISRDGSEIAVEDSAAPILNRAGEITGVVLVSHDVTQSRKLTNQISWQASHTVFLIYTFGDLQVWHIYAVSILASFFTAFQYHAYSAAVTTMLSKEDYARAEEMMGSARALSGILAPFFAAALLGVVGLSGIMLIDLATFLFAFGTLLFIHGPQPAQTETGLQSRGTLWKEIVFGFRYINEKKSLRALTVLFMAAGVFLAVGATLMDPLVLLGRGTINQRWQRSNRRGQWAAWWEP